MDPEASDRTPLPAMPRAVRPVPPRRLVHEAWSSDAAALPEPPAPEVLDSELVRRAVAGDDDAYGGLVARYHRRAFWIAYHVVGRVEDARDVSQEAFVKVYRSLRRFDFSRNFYTWFYRIVVNLAIDALRKRQCVAAAALDEFGDRIAAPDSASDPAERQELRGLVWAALDKLGPKFKPVLVLRDIHGMSCREIAPILRVTHATVRWRLHRGRQMFREHWDRIAKDAD